mgnify:CR=1 FL=1
MRLLQIVLQRLNKKSKSSTLDLIQSSLLKRSRCSKGQWWMKSQAMSSNSQLLVTAQLCSMTQSKKRKSHMRFQRFSGMLKSWQTGHRELRITKTQDRRDFTNSWCLSFNSWKKSLWITTVGLLAKLQWKTWPLKLRNLREVWMCAGLKEQLRHQQSTFTELWVTSH